MIWTPSLSLKEIPATSSKATTSHRPTRPTVPASHVVEQVGNGGLPAGNQDAVRADFLVDVALAGAAWPKFADVVVVLDQRDHPGQQVPLHPLARSCVGSMPVERSSTSIHCSSVNASPPLEQLLHVHVRHLDRLQVLDDERRSLLPLLVEVLQRDDAPDAADQQLLVLLDDARCGPRPP